MTTAHKDLFRRCANTTSRSMGSPWAFSVALAIVLLWLASGPFFHFSDTWQLVINTSTTIITFLMVFLIQNTQNRDAVAMHLKLDELIRAVKGARNDMVDLEELSDEEIKTLQAEFRRLGAEHPHEVRSRAEQARAKHAKVAVFEATLGALTSAVHPGEAKGGKSGHDRRTPPDDAPDVDGDATSTASKR